MVVICRPCYDLLKRRVRALALLAFFIGYTSRSFTAHQPENEPLSIRVGEGRTCHPQNVYIDLGANWAQTLNLHKKILTVKHKGVQKLRPHKRVPFRVFAFEASPYIAPYVEESVAYLNGEVSATQAPQLPFPDTGSSKDLARINQESGLPCPTALDQLRKCFLARYKSKLDELAPLDYLNSTYLIRDRLSIASSLKTRGKDEYVFIPAAASSKDATVTIKQSKLGLLIGGTTTKGSEGNYAHLGDDYFPAALVHSVNVVKWLGQHFRTCDLVVIKMDVEGAEHDIIPALVHSGAHQLVDILAWECHEKGGSCSNLRKLLRQTKIIVLEEGRDYDGWR